MSDDPKPTEKCEVSPRPSLLLGGGGWWSMYDWASGDLWKIPCTDEEVSNAPPRFDDPRWKYCDNWKRARRGRSDA